MKFNGTKKEFLEMLNSEKVHICLECNKPIHWLEVLPGHVCIKCHELKTIKK